MVSGVRTPRTPPRRIPRRDWLARAGGRKRSWPIKCQWEPKSPHLCELKIPHPGGSLRGLGGADEAGLELVLEPIGIAPNVEGDRVVEDAVQDGGGDDPVA